MLVLGSFDASGSPVTAIQAIGADGASTSYQATIDTGFTGFIALNEKENEHLNLQVLGATSVTLGDGSTKKNPFVVGQASLGGQTRSGIIIFDKDSRDVLIGLDFLRQFGLALIITATVVILYDTNEALEAVFGIMARSEQGNPNTAPMAITSGGGHQ